MKWTKKYPPVLTKGESRIVRRFLFLPRRIGEEVRWLGFVRIRQEANTKQWVSDAGGYEYIGWCDREFLPLDDHRKST